MKNQSTSLRFLKKCGSLFVQLVASLVSISALFLFLLLLFLSFKPLPLNFLLPYLTPQLEALSPDLSVKNISLVWRRWENPFELQLDDLSLNLSVDQKIQIPHVAIHLNFLKALQGEILISQATLLEASLSLGGGENPLEIAKFFDPSFGAGLEVLTLQDPSFCLPFCGEPVTWPGLSLHIKRQKNLLSVEAALQNVPFLTATIRLDPLDDTLAVSGNLNALKLPPFFKKFFSFLSQIPAFSGSFEGVYDLKQNIWRKGQGTLVQENKAPGLLRIGAQSLPFEAAQAQVSLTDHTFTLDHLNFKLGAHRVKLQGHFEEKSQKYFVEAHVLDPISPPALFLLWPEALAPYPRAWVLKNITAGSAQQIVARATGTWKGGLTSLSGQAKLEGLTISYLEGMPMVKNVDGAAVFDTQKIFVTFTKGTLEQQIVQKGTLLIRGLDQERADLKLDLQTQGPLKNILSIIDSPPLQYARQLDFEPGSCVGKTTANLKLSFPLKSDLTFKDITLHVDGHLTDVSFATLVEKTKFPLSLKKGAFKLNVTEKKLALKGEASVNGRKTNVFWEEKFGPHGRRLYGLTKILTPAELLSWNLDLSDWVSGDFVVSLVYNIPQGKTTSFLELKANFEKAALDFPFLNWKKPAGVEALCSASIAFSPQGKIALKDFQFRAKEMSAAGRMTFSQDKALECLDLPLLKAPHTEASVLLTHDLHKGYALTLKGKSFNFSALFAKHGPIGRLFLKPQTPLTLSLSLESGFAGEGRTTHHLCGFFKGHQGIKEIAWDSIDISGATGTLPRDSQKRFPQGFRISFQQKNLLVQASDAGSFLKMVGIHSEIKGGHLVLKSQQVDPGKPYVGRMKIKDFAVKNMPVLTRLLALSSPAGIIDFISTEELSFSRFDAHFSALNDQIILHDARAISTGLGIVFNGTIDQRKQSLFLVGNIIPAYMVNSVLSAIPLLGDLFFGGKDSGFLATRFTLKGPIENPEIDVNPFYFLAPGILKHLFQDDTEEEKHVRDAEKEMREGKGL